MKSFKKMMALLLAVCMLVGMPLTVDVSAIGRHPGFPAGFKLTQAMVIPDSWNTGLTSGKAIALYFTGNVKIDLDKVGAFVTLVDRSNGNSGVGAGDVSHNGSQKLYIWQANLAKRSETGVNDYYVELTGSSTVADIMKLHDEKWPGSIVAVRLYEKHEKDSTFGPLANANSGADGKGDTAETWSIDNKIAGITNQADNAALASNRYCHWNGHTWDGLKAESNTRDCIDVPITTVDSADTFKLVSAAYDPDSKELTIKHSHQYCYCYAGSGAGVRHFRAVTADGEYLYKDSNGNYKPESQKGNGDALVGTGSNPLVDAGNDKSMFTQAMDATAAAAIEACKTAAAAYGNGAYAAVVYTEAGLNASLGEGSGNGFIDTIWTSHNNPTKPLLATHRVHGEDRAIVPILEWATITSAEVLHRDGEDADQLLVTFSKPMANVDGYNAIRVSTASGNVLYENERDIQWEVDLSPFNGSDTTYIGTITNNTNGGKGIYFEDGTSTNTWAAIQEYVTTVLNKGSMVDGELRMDDDYRIDFMIENNFHAVAKDGALLKPTMGERGSCKITDNGKTYAAKVEDTYYFDMDEALTNTTSGEINLLTNVEMSAPVLMINSGVTIDLNGKELTVGNVIAFGEMIDSTNGTGKLVVSNDTTKAFVQLQPTNSQMPLYDTDGYRFFGYSVVNKGVIKVDDDVTKYGVRLNFDSDEAFEILANGGAYGAELVMNIAAEGYTDMYYRIKTATLQDFASGVLNYKATEGKDYTSKTIVLKISGLSEIESELSVTAEFSSVTNPCKTADIVAIG